MRYLIIFLLVTLLAASDTNEVGRYQLEVTTYINKKGTTYIVETVLDTKTGFVIKRRKINASKYKLPYKNRKGEMVIEE